MKNFFIQLCFRELEQDTRGLSCAAFGSWMRILNMMWGQETGKLTGDIDYFSRLCGTSCQDFVEFLSEFIQQNVADIQQSNGQVTVICRRLTKEYKNKENSRLRKQRYDEKKGNASVTEKERQSNAKVTDTYNNNKNNNYKKEKEEKKNDVDNSSGVKEKIPEKISIIFSKFNFPYGEKNDTVYALKIFQIQIEKKLSEKDMLDQLDAFFIFFTDYESEKSDKKRYENIQSKSHLWNLLFRWIETAYTKEQRETWIKNLTSCKKGK